MCRQLRFGHQVGHKLQTKYLHLGTNVTQFQVNLHFGVKGYSLKSCLTTYGQMDNEFDKVHDIVSLICIRTLLTVQVVFIQITPFRLLKYFFSGSLIHWISILIPSQSVVPFNFVRRSRNLQQILIPAVLLLSIECLIFEFCKFNPVAVDDALVVIWTYGTACQISFH